MLGTIIIGIITCLCGWVAIPLSCFIKRIENEVACKKCSVYKECYGQKKVFLRDLNYLSEWMLVSFLKLRGKCTYAEFFVDKRACIYFLGNAMLLAGLFWSKGMGADNVLWVISVSVLLSLSVVDWNTQYIPLEMNIIIFLCGLVHLYVDLSNWLDYIIGLIAVSGFLLLVNFIATPVLKKRYTDELAVDSVIGDGDIKLMAATGLLLGWKLNFIALGIGCLAGSAIHLILMKVKGSGRQFALGPYLSLGVYITMICGEQLISWYLNVMGVTPY